MLMKRQLWKMNLTFQNLIAILNISFHFIRKKQMKNLLFFASRNFHTRNLLIIILFFTKNLKQILFSQYIFLPLTFNSHCCQLVIIRQRIRPWYLNDDRSLASIPASCRGINTKKTVDEIWTKNSEHLVRIWFAWINSCNCLIVLQLDLWYLNLKGLSGTAI